jgi:hypothetical protein
MTDPVSNPGPQRREASDYPLKLCRGLFWVPYCRLLRLAGSRWRYSTPPPHGLLSHVSGRADRSDRWVWSNSEIMISRINQRKSEKEQYQCHFAHHESHFYSQ